MRELILFSNEDLFTAISEHRDANDQMSLIRDILKQGVDPNQPIIKEYVVGWGGSVRNHYIYPLHAAKDPNVVTLLLEFGADPNLRGFAKPGEHQYHYPACDYKEISAFWDNLTPLEGALFDCVPFHNSLKAHALAQFSPCIMQTNTIENAIRLFLSHLYDIRDGKYDPHFFLSSYNFKKDKRRYLPLLRSLISKLDLQTLISMEKELRLTLEAAHIKYTKLSLVFEIFEFYQKRHAQINNLALVWTFLNKGIGQPNSALYGLTADILSIILSAVVREIPPLDKAAFDFISQHSSQDHQLKITSFKKIYKILSDMDTIFSQHTFLENKTDITSIRLIRDIQLKVDNEPESLTAMAWKLTLRHHKNTSIKYEKLVDNMLEWGLQKNISYKLTFFDSSKKDCEMSLKKESEHKLGETTQHSLDFMNE